MSFDEQPDGDPHGECAAEIARLEAENARLIAELNTALQQVKTEQRLSFRDQVADLEQQRDELSKLCDFNQVTMEQLLQQRDELLAASQAVIDRWETPLWKDVPATAEYIHALRAAVENATPCVCMVPGVRVKS